MRVSSGLLPTAIRVVATTALLATALAGGSATAAVTREAGHAPGTALASGGPSGWRIAPAPLPPEIDGFSSLSCGSRTLCLAVAGTGGLAQVLLRSTDGGVHWRQVLGTPPAFSFIKVSCASATRCMATLAGRRFDGPANRVATSTDGGRTWQVEPPIPAKNEGPLQCVTASTCYLFNVQRSYLAGGIERTTDFGKHWATEHISGANASAINSIKAVNCSSSSTCLAVARWNLHGNPEPVVTTANGGRTWTVHATTATGLIEVSCGSARDCLATGQAGRHADAVATTDGGISWHDVTIPSELGTGWAVACTSPRTCLIGGEYGKGISNNGLIARTTDLGRSWSVTKTTAKYGFPTAISCPTVSYCVTTRQSNGNTVPVPPEADGWFVTADSGASWHRTGMPVELADLQSVACPTATVCFAAGGLTGAANDAVVLRSGDGGQSWHVVLITARLQALSSISCPSARECVAVGTLNWGTGHAIARTSDGGSHWQVNAAPAGMVTLASVTCPVTSFCLALGQTSDDRRGHSWFLRSTDAGQRWSTEHAPKGVGFLFGLSCASRSTCTAVGDSFNPKDPAIIERTTDGGLRWTAQRAPHGVTILDSVACPDTRTCYAFNDAFTTAAIAVTHNGGGTWLRQRLRGPAGATIGPSGLACMTSQDCVGIGLAVDEPGLQSHIFETLDGGSTWVLPPLPPGTGWLLGVGCSRRACVAVGADGQIMLSPTR